VFSEENEIMAIEQSVIASLGINRRDLNSGMVSDIEYLFSIMMGKNNMLYLPLIHDLVNDSAECVTAKVGFQGSCSGELSLHAPKKLALDFASGMLGTEMTELNADVHDAFGEMANIIAGSFSRYLTRGGAHVRLSLPSVLVGKDYSVSTKIPDDTFLFCFVEAGQSFQVRAFLASGS
jgi:chemotaxis protein CheX